MADLPAGAIFPKTVIAPYSPMSIGAEMIAAGAGTGSSTWQVANNGVFIPTRVHAPVTVVKMAVGVGTATAGNIDVGIYDSTGNRVVRMGSTALGSINTFQTFDIPDTTLMPGLFYLAVACSSASATLLQSAIGNVMMRAAGCFTMASAFSTGLVATATFAAVNASVTRVPSVFAYTVTTI